MTSAIAPSSSASPSTVGSALPWAPLLSRTVLFAAAQLAIAAGLAVSGHSSPWAASAGWWPVSAFVANVVSIAWIAKIARAEGLSPRKLFHLDGSHLGRDLLVFVGVLLLAAPIAQLPNMGLATVLWGSPEAALRLFVQPIPRWAALIGLVLFPLTIAFAELPTYFAIARGRMQRAGWKGPALVVVPALFLALQHVTLPLIFDARFLTWRLFMFVPFALFLGAVVHWRPRMLPWLMVGHGLIDVGAGYLVFAASA